jgi:glucose/mannose transport system permease protein
VLATPRTAGATGRDGRRASPTTAVVVVGDAGQIDGAGLLGIYRRIALPLSLPGFVVVGIWQFTQIWNEFLWAVTLTSAGQRPVMVALQNISGSQIVEFDLQMAAAMQAALPTLIIYVLLGRYFVRGLLAGAVKG